MLTRAAVPGMLARRGGTIINVAGMIAFSGPAPAAQLPRRAVYADTLAHTVAMSQSLSAEREGTGVRVHTAWSPTIMSRVSRRRGHRFHTVQGMDLSAIPRMTADAVAAGSLRGLELGEVVCAPGVQDYTVLQPAFDADLVAFGAQSPTLAPVTGPTDRSTVD